MSGIDDFAEYCSAPCRDSPESYLWWAGLGLFSAVLGRGFWVSGAGGADIDRLYPNLYILLMGIGGASDRVIDETTRFLLGGRILRASDEFSNQMADRMVGVGSELDAHLMPKNLSSMLDQHSRSSHRAMLCEGYDVSTRYRQPQYSLCLSLLCGCTPNHLNSVFRRGEWQEGLPSRFVYIWGATQTRENKSRDAALESKIHNRIRDIQDHLLISGGQRITWSTEAQDAMDKWASSTSQPPHMNVMGYWARRQETLIKICVCLAVSDLRFEISLNDWNTAAQRLIAAERSLDRALGHGTTNPYAAHEQWLEAWIKSQGKRQLTYGELLSRMSWCMPKDRDQIIEDLQNRGVLCQDQPTNQMFPTSFRVGTQQSIISGPRPTLVDTQGVASAALNPTLAAQFTVLNSQD